MIKVIVDNGWYTFSPTGHAYYNRNDEVKVHGKNKFLKYVKGLYEGAGLISFNIDNFDQRTNKNILVNC